jgi:hypothetical protein
MDTLFLCYYILTGYFTGWLERKGGPSHKRGAAEAMSGVWYRMQGKQ